MDINGRKYNNNVLSQSIYGHNDSSSVAAVTKKFLRSALIATTENMNYNILSTCKLRPQIPGYTNLIAYH